MEKSTRTQSSGTSRNDDNEDYQALLKRNQELEYTNYIHSLGNEQNFRLRLIQELELIRNGILDLKETIVSVSSNESDEKSNEKTSKDDEEDDEDEEEEESDEPEEKGERKEDQFYAEQVGKKSKRR